MMVTSVFQSSPSAAASLSTDSCANFSGSSRTCLPASVIGVIFNVAVIAATLWDDKLMTNDKDQKESGPEIRAADKKAIRMVLLQLKRVDEATAQSFAAGACQSQHHKKLLGFANFASQDARRPTECW